ncbi:MAG: chemotaxis protein CheY [Peptococcaceae bacterium BICA1-8]|nr:MAG: chemotaxis protein CheY [Peptococcaceae bacterium BICA1-8]
MRFIRANLVASNFEVITAKDGREALEKYEQLLPDLILLDLMLPEIGGFDVLKNIREYSSVPVIIITAKGNTSDTIRGLELGADDYVVKPFDINELLARINAVVRRCIKERIDDSPILNTGELHINLASYKVKVGINNIKLTPTEFKLLAELAINNGKVITHEALLTKIWGLEYRDETHYLRVCVARIRQKLKLRDGDIGFIQTIPTVGYKMQEDTTL